jgi:Ca2+-binding EF-hand superfamily protein
MMRLFSLGCLVATLVLSVNPLRADDPTPQPPPRRGEGEKAKGRDLQVIFKRLDTNNDGKLSKEEFKKLGELIAQRAQGRFKDRPELIEKLMQRFFEKLDTNKDGSISKEEFKKISELRGQLGDRIKNREKK